MKLTFAKFIMQTLLKITFFIHTLVEHKIFGNGPMIVHRRKSSVIGIRTKSTNCKKKKLAFNNLNFNLKYLPYEILPLSMCNLDTIQGFLWALGMKQQQNLVETITFFTTKIIRDLLKDCKNFIFKFIFLHNGILLIFSMKNIGLEYQLSLMKFFDSF